MSRLKFVTLVSFSLSILLAHLSPEKTTDSLRNPLPRHWLLSDQPIQTPKEHIRPGDQTFLTYPEWFLVHSPREQADYFSKHTATSFPYFSHILQMWKSYRLVNRQISGVFKFNGGYHMMIWVIASSTTVEYALKAFYEKLIGRITDTGNVATAEDQLNADYMRDYVNFIMQTPWYEYDYFSQLRKLWQDVPYFGNHPIRKWERRFYLSYEFLVKGMYGWVIKKATKSIYEEPILGTAVVVHGGKRTDNPAIRFLKTLPDGSSLLMLPRYGDFAPAARELALAGAQFGEVAGNATTILVTVKGHAAPEIGKDAARVIFTQPIVTAPGTSRVAFAVRIAHLHKFLLSVEKTGAQLEHIYDF
jgi:hypothetical protein